MFLFPFIWHYGNFSPVSLSLYSPILLSALSLEYRIPVIHSVNPLGLSSTLHHRARAARARYTAHILPVFSTEGGIVAATVF